MKFKLTSVIHIPLEIYGYLHISHSYIIIDGRGICGELGCPLYLSCQINNFSQNSYSCQWHEHLTTIRNKSPCLNLLH